jgi:lipopolysaccharide biosynthesis glycosyltransferase
MTVHVACAARRDYVPHAAAMLHSVLETTGGAGVEIHFLHGGDWPRDHQRLLTEMVESGGGRISFLRVGRDRVAGLRTHDSLPASHWYRVFLPELLPGHDRVLYLDGDLIAVDTLEPLSQTELGDDYLGAVTNVFQHDHLNRIAELGLPDPRLYFNSGVLLMNLELMRRDGCTRQIVEYARANPGRLSWPEQDALNLLLGDRRLALHPRWNLMNSLLLFESAGEVFGADVLAEARANPAIRHFEGPAVNKPWHADCERPDRELYARHRAETPWPSFELERNAGESRLRRLASRLRGGVSA